MKKKILKQVTRIIKMRWINEYMKCDEQRWNFPRCCWDDSGWMWKRVVIIIFVCLVRVLEFNTQNFQNKISALLVGVEKNKTRNIQVMVWVIFTKKIGLFLNKCFLFSFLIKKNIFIRNFQGYVYIMFEIIGM